MQKSTRIYYSHDDDIDSCLHQFHPICTPRLAGWLHRLNQSILIISSIWHWFCVGCWHIVRPDTELMMRLTRLFGQLGCSSDGIVAKLCIIAMRFVALTKKKLNLQALPFSININKPRFCVRRTRFVIIFFTTVQTSKYDDDCMLYAVAVGSLNRRYWFELLSLSSMDRNYINCMWSDLKLNRMIYWWFVRFSIRGVIQTVWHLFKQNITVSKRKTILSVVSYSIHNQQYCRKFPISWIGVNSITPMRQTATSVVIVTAVTVVATPLSAVDEIDQSAMAITFRSWTQ